MVIEAPYYRRVDANSDAQGANEINTTSSISKEDIDRLHDPIINDGSITLDPQTAAQINKLGKGAAGAVAVAAQSTGNLAGSAMDQAKNFMQELCSTGPVSEQTAKTRTWILGAGVVGTGLFAIHSVINLLSHLIQGKNKGSLFLKFAQVFGACFITRGLYNTVAEKGTLGFDKMKTVLIGLAGLLGLYTINSSLESKEPHALVKALGGEKGLEALNSLTGGV